MKNVGFGLITDADTDGISETVNLAICRPMQGFNNEFECTLHLSDIAFPAIQDNLELGAQGNRWGCGSLSLGRWKFS